MATGALSFGQVQNLVFWAGQEREECVDDDDPAELEPVSDLLDNLQEAIDFRQSQDDKPESMYVTLLHDMLNEATKEGHLFSDEEFELLIYYATLPYHARYLLVRLLLRKECKCIRLSNLKYTSELGSSANIIAAMNRLCGDISPPTLKLAKPKPQKGTADDAISISDDEEDDPPCEVKAEPAPEGKVPIVYAEDETEIPLRELLGCLRSDELSEVGRSFKVKGTLKGESLISELLKVTAYQGTLNFPRTGVKKKNQMHQSKLQFGQPQTQQERLRIVVIKMLEKCIRVHPDVHATFRRVNLVYFRSTTHSPSLLTSAILSKSSKRYYAVYQSSRTMHIWRTRQDLLDYEWALAREAEIVSLLDGSGTPGTSRTSRGSKTPAPSHKFRTPVTPISAVSSVRNSSIAEDGDGPSPPAGSPRQQAALEAKRIFDDVYPRWQALVKVKGEEEGRPAGLERFHYGHVLTRVVCKGATALKILNKYDEELEVYEALLAQTRWRRASRGKWYDRRALLLTFHHAGGGTNDEDLDNRALEGIKHALMDDDTHMVFRPNLQKRLAKLEKKLKLPAEERHSCAGSLAQAEKRYFHGTRIQQRAGGLKLDSMGRAIKPVTTLDSPLLRRPILLNAQKAEPTSTPTPEPKWKGKSIWEGKDGEEVNVETLVLQRYEELGYRGFHSEGSIVRTLFGLLFWDVIFADVPGAFETKYQSAPLDIAEDCFYRARESLIKKRLDEIEQGNAPQILNEVDDEHRATETWCVGVRWDLFTKEDLVEIVHCLGGHVLAVICRLLCEDYSGQGGGVPDLIIWNRAKGSCKFVEVKGPGDALRRNQEVWISVLVRGGAEVEVCRVMEHGTSIKKPKSTKSVANSSAKRKTRGQRKASSSSDSESEPVIAESEGEVGVHMSSQGWGPDEDDSKVPVDKDSLPVFTIQTRFRTRAAMDAEVDTDDEEVDQLDPTPSNSQTTAPPLQHWRGTKRKSDEDVLASPTPKQISRSASQLVPEVVIVMPSPKKKRLAR